MSQHCVFKEFYLDKMVPSLKKDLSLANIHEVPRFEKIIINSGIRSGVEKVFQEKILNDITRISGQKPVFTLAKESISNFKVRKGMPVGVRVTLRGRLMWEFMYKFLHVVLPGVRDFRGLSSKLDGTGNCTIGISDHTVFPEIKLDGQYKQQVGMDITFVTTASSDLAGKCLFKLAGFPFRKS